MFIEIAQLSSVTACRNEYEDQSPPGVMIRFNAIQAALAALGSRLRMHFPTILPQISRRQIRIQKPECVRHSDDAHSSLALLLDDLIAQHLHPRPMHFWAKMVFCVVAIVKPGPVIQLPIGAHAPGDRLVWIAAVVSIVAVQIRETVAEIPKRQKETNVMPV